MPEQSEIDIHLAIRKLEQEIHDLRARVYVLERDSDSVNNYITRLDEEFSNVVKYIQNK